MVLGRLIPASPAVEVCSRTYVLVHVLYLLDWENVPLGGAWGKSGPTSSCTRESGPLDSLCGVQGATKAVSVSSCHVSLSCSWDTFPSHHHCHQIYVPVISCSISPL